MGYKGRYESKKPQKAKKPASKGKKILLIVLLVLLLLIVGIVIAAVIYWNSMLGMLSDPKDVTRPSMSDEDYAAMMAEATEATPGEEETEASVETTVETSPEDTWPVIVSDENITNIMLVGQAARPGEEALIADTMILCSINRETKTLTMTSLMRDLRLVWPKYVDVNGQSHMGNNRINMAYNMGYRWDGNVQGGMNLLASIVEYNFGVPVDHSVEVNFEIFENVINIVGGVDVEINSEELSYLQSNYNWMDKLTVGTNHLDGYQALCYARMRKVGHGDYERTERQREVITSLLTQMKDMGIMDIHKMFTEILPLITTDMTSSEITNYAFEFIPMLKDLTIQSQRIPFDDTYWPIEVEIDGQTDYQLECNVKKNGELLRESIGMTSTEE